jgi:hypothetical protein
MLDSLGKVTGRDRDRGLLDRTKGSQTQTYDPEGEYRKRREDCSGRDQLDQDQAVHRAVDTREPARKQEDVSGMPRSIDARTR